jgi:hypothetical protein
MVGEKLISVSKAIRSEIEKGVTDSETILKNVNSRIESGEVKKSKNGDKGTAFLIKRCLKK